MGTPHDESSCSPMVDGCTRMLITLVASSRLVTLSLALIVVRIRSIVVMRSVSMGLDSLRLYRFRRQPQMWLLCQVLVRPSSEYGHLVDAHITDHDLTCRTIPLTQAMMMVALSRTYLEQCSCNMYICIVLATVLAHDLCNPT